MTNSELFDSIDADSFYIDGSEIADTKAPKVSIERRWEDRRFQARLVNPANRRKLSVIIVGSGLAGSSAAATLGEAGYNVNCFCYQDTPRRAHSVSRRRAGSTPPKTIATTAIRSFACSTTPLKAATFGRANPMSIDWPKLSVKSSTNASPKECRSHVNMAACWITAHSAAYRSRARSTRAARPASSCCSACIRHWSDRSAPGP